MCTALDEFRKISNEQADNLKLVSDARGYSTPKILLAMCAIFIKNTTYLERISKTEKMINIINSFDNKEHLVGRVVFPITTPDLEVISIGIYDVISYVTNKLNNENNNYYYYPANSYTHKKSRLVYAIPEVWNTIIESDSIYLTDGIFDSAHSAVAGVPTLALMDSNLTLEKIQILNQFKYIYLLQDADIAGKHLYQKLYKTFQHVYSITPPIGSGIKDVDEYIKVYGENVFIKQLEPKRINIILGGS